MIGLQRETASLWARKIRNLDDSAGDIVRQIANKPFNETSDVASLQCRVARFRSLLGPEGILETVITSVGKAWIANPGPVNHRDGFSVELSTFKKLSPTVEDWKQVIGMLGALESMPGVGIASFEMKSSGALDSRKVELLEIIVEMDSKSPVSTP
jgi:hypothetical protein